MEDSKKIFRNYLEEMREGCERKRFAGLGPQLHALLEDRLDQRASRGRREVTVPAVGAAWPW
jgi:hypothetical protein